MAANRRLGGAIATALVLVTAWACAPSTGGRSSASSLIPSQVSTTPAPIGPLGTASCRPVSPTGAFTGEVYGTATGGTVWAWFMVAYPPRAGIEDKTIWRFDGQGASWAPTFTLAGPASQAGRLNWGPSIHDSSSWNRPGTEFGTGLLFPTTGCWDVHVTVGLLTGDVYVVVT